MARFRSIDSDVWRHPDFRRAGHVGREVYLYLISSGADDEGRFIADPELILEAVFPQRDAVQIGEVEEALRYLAEVGLILLYAVGRVGYGFLTGWYEHQRIDKRYREESSLPAPPANICSWDQVDLIRVEYTNSLPPEKDAKGKPKPRKPEYVSYRQALRWHAQKGRDDPARIPSSIPTDSRGNLAGISGESLGNPALDRIGQDRTGQDRKGGEGVPPAPEVENGRRERITFQGSDAHLYGPESGVWQLFVNELSPSIPESGNGFCNLREWGLRLARADADEAYPLHGEDLREALRKNRPSSSTSPRDHVAFLEKQYHAQKNAVERDPTPEDPAEASARIYRETPWAFKTPEAIAVQVGQWEQLLFDTFGKPENAEVERQYHAAWREYQATGDAEAFPLPPEGLGVPT